MRVAQLLDIDKTLVLILYKEEITLKNTFMVKLITYQNDRKVLLNFSLHSHHHILEGSIIALTGTKFLY